MDGLTEGQPDWRAGINPPNTALPRCFLCPWPPPPSSRAPQSAPQRQVPLQEAPEAEHLAEI